MNTLVVKRRNLLLATLLVAFALCVPASIASPPPQAYAPNTLHELSSVEQFRVVFQEARGTTRVVLLLSPT